MSKEKTILQYPEFVNKRPTSLNAPVKNMLPQKVRFLNKTHGRLLEKILYVPGNNEAWQNLYLGNTPWCPCSSQLPIKNRLAPEKNLYLIP